MLRTIELPALESDPDDPHALAQQARCGRIIKRADIQRNRQVIDILEKARAQATEVLDRTQREAAQQRAAGFREGVKSGMLAALSPVSAMIDQWEATRRALRQASLDALQESLASLTKHELALVALAKMTFDAHSLEQPNAACFRVPKGVCTQALEEHCRTIKLDATIESSDQPDEFSIVWGGHVWTAHLGEVAQVALAEVEADADQCETVDPIELCREALLEVLNSFGHPSGQNE